MLSADQSLFEQTNVQSALNFEFQLFHEKHRILC